MELDFLVQRWAVWPPIPSNEASDKLLQAELLAGIPKLLKRRLTPLARTAFCAAIQCLNGDQKPIPTVFSACHGELDKSLTMLKHISAGEALSPTAFSLSVHNAIAGLFGMAFHNQLQTTVIASGEEGVAPAFIEALGLLQEGAERVLLVFYDEPLPSFFPAEPFHLSSDSCLALALIIAPRGEGAFIRMASTEGSGPGCEQPLQLPSLVRFLQTGQRFLQFESERLSWYWEKYA